MNIEGNMLVVTTEIERQAIAVSNIDWLIMIQIILESLSAFRSRVA
jgi:hypothetical protein